MQSKAQKFIERRMRETNWPKYDICTPPTSAQECMNVLIDHFLGPDWYENVLIDHFLGPDWYDIWPETQEQVNTLAVCEILSKHPRG